MFELIVVISAFSVITPIMPTLTPCTSTWTEGVTFSQSTCVPVDLLDQIGGQQWEVHLGRA